MSNKKWFPHSKGGEFRKWYGNREWVVNWANDGYEIRNFSDNHGNIRSRPQAAKFYFKESISWSLISWNTPAFRFEPEGNIIGHKGPGIFMSKDKLLQTICLLNSCVTKKILEIISPTMGLEIGQISKLPLLTYLEPSLMALKFAERTGILVKPLGIFTVFLG